MSLPSQQQALIIPHEQGPWTLQTFDVDQPGPGEVLVRIESAALNPVDWKVQKYGWFVSEYPAIVGSDSAGVVVAVGEGVTNFVVGDRVLHQGYFTNHLGTFKQYTIISADLAAKIPDGISFDEAASIPVGLSTAVVGLYGGKWPRGGVDLVAPWKEGGRGKYANQPIIILGGSSSVGQFTIQVAKLSGFSPIITTVSPRNNDLVKSLGATHPIDRNLSDSDLIAAVKQITSEPVKLVYDTISEESTQSVAHELLAPGGTLVLALASLIPDEKRSPEKAVLHTFGTFHTDDSRELGKELYSNLTALLKSGELRPNPVEVLPSGLSGIPEGLERLENNKVSGRKLIARPQETVVLK